MSSLDEFLHHIWSAETSYFRLKEVIERYSEELFVPFELPVFPDKTTQEYRSILIDCAHILEALKVAAFRKWGSR